MLRTLTTPSAPIHQDLVRRMAEDQRKLQRDLKAQVAMRKLAEEERDEIKKNGAGRLTRSSGTVMRLNQQTQLASDRKRRLGDKDRQLQQQGEVHLQRDMALRKNKNAAHADKRKLKRQVVRYAQQAKRRMDPNAKPDSIKKMALWAQATINGHSEDAVKALEEKDVALQEAKNLGLLSLLGVRARGQPAPCELWDLGLKLMSRGISAGWFNS
jgi:hypothetical protein